MEHTQKTFVETQGVDTEKIFQKVRIEVIESYPSIFSKDDVILLIDRIQREVGNPTISSEKLDKLKDELIDGVKDVIRDFDYDDVIELSVDGREISVDFDSPSLLVEVEERINDIFEDIG